MSSTRRPDPKASIPAPGTVEIRHRPDPARRAALEELLSGSWRAEQPKVAQAAD